MALWGIALEYIIEYYFQVDKFSFFLNNLLILQVTLNIQVYLGFPKN